MKNILIGTLCLVFIFAGFSLLAQEKCEECPKKKGCVKSQAQELIALWEDLVTKGFKPDANDMKILEQCPFFQARMKTEMFMKKAVHANWHLYQLHKASCEECKNLKDGEMCEKCKEMMKKIPEDVRNKMMARWFVVTKMAETGHKIMELRKKINPECKVAEPVKCDVKDMEGMKKKLVALSEKADKVIAMWKEAPSKFEALPEATKNELKAQKEKMVKCPGFNVMNKTCEFFTKAVDMLVKLDTELGQKCTSKEFQANKDYEAINAVYKASADMNLKTQEVIKAMNAVMEKK